MQYRHLHPFAIFISLRYLIFGIMPLFVIPDAVGLLIFLGTIFYIILYFYKFRYAVTADQIWIQQGVIIKKQEHIPLKRIQTIHHQQSLWLQPFKLETLKLATASKHGFQIKLSVIPQSVGKLIEDRYHAALHSDASINKNDTTIYDNGDELGSRVVRTEKSDYHINARDMHLFAATSFRILLCVAIMLHYYGVIELYFETYIWPVLFRWTGHDAVFVAGLLIILIGFIISYLSLWIQYYNFHLTREDGYLIFSRGGVNYDTIKISEHQIQGIVLERNIVREWLGLISIKLIMISDENSKNISNQPLVLPVIRRTEWLNFQPQFFPWLPVDNPRMSAHRRRSEWLFFRNYTLVLILIAGGSIYWWPQYWWLISIFFILGVNLSLANAWYKYQRTQVGVNGLNTDAFLYLKTSRYFITRTTVVNWHQIQSMQFRQSMWMTQSQLAHLTINIRSGSSEVKMHMRYLDASEAQRIYTWYRQMN
jgi:putative membrane protein